MALPRLYLLPGLLSSEPAGQSTGLGPWGPAVILGGQGSHVRVKGCGRNPQGHS